MAATTSVKFYNSFDVKEDDFRDISCIECSVNGQHFDCLVLCADCGNFLCRACIVPHMRNSDENHNATKIVTDESKKHKEELSRSSKELVLTDRDIPPTSDSNRELQINHVRQELNILQSVLQQLHVSKSEKLALTSNVQKVAYDRLTEFRSQVLNELSVLQTEVKNNIDTQVTEYINGINVDIEQVDKQVLSVKNLLKSMESLAEQKKTNDSMNTIDWAWCCQELELELKALTKKMIEQNDNDLSIEAMERELLNSAKQPLDYFSYRVSKLNPFMYTDDINMFLEGGDTNSDESVHEDISEQTDLSVDTDELYEEISEPTPDNETVSDLYSGSENESSANGSFEEENIELKGDKVFLTHTISICDTGDNIDNESVSNIHNNDDADDNEDNQTTGDVECDSTNDSVSHDEIVLDNGNVSDEEIDSEGKENDSLHISGSRSETSRTDDNNDTSDIESRHTSVNNVSNVVDNVANDNNDDNGGVDVSLENYQSG